MKITRKIYLLLLAFVVSQAMAAQTVLTGKVLEKASGEPLAGASVFVQNKDERTLASVLVDANGEYRIRIPDEQDLVINFSFIGMQTYTVKYTGQKVLNASLTEESRTLDEVSVSAQRVQRNQMGLTPREELGAVQRMSMEGLETAPVTSVAEALQGMAGVLIGPGFGERGIPGKLVAAKYARTHDIPTFGICLGMQCMAIEFARNVLGLADANSREMDEKTPHNVIDIMEEQKSITNMGGTMRLGAYECVLQPGSKAYEAYGTEHIQERHRHRYEFNNQYREAYEAAGMKCVGVNPESDLVEVVEIPTLKWYIGTQFHPEYSSTVLHPHPLFLSFVKAAIENEHLNS